MRQLTPLITAVLVMLGLIGFVGFNATRVVPSRSATTVDVSPPTAATASPPPTTTSAPTTSPAAPTTIASLAPALPYEAVYAGRAENSKLAVAVAVKGDKAAAYLCDGARVEAWMTGQATNGRIEVASANKNASLVAGLDGNALTGNTRVGTSEYRFVISAAHKPGGLYRNKDGATTIGWIVLPDGSQVGIANTGGQPSPAPSLDAASATATVNGRQVTAYPVSGEITQ